MTASSTNVSRRRLLGVAGAGALAGAAAIGGVELARADEDHDDTPEAGLAWIERQWGRHEHGQGLSLAVANAGTEEALGNINLLFRPQRGTAELGYWLVERVRGRGLGSRAVALLARWIEDLSPESTTK